MNKNIYILTTDNLTRVHKDSELFISPKYQLSKSINSSVEGLNIYITSDDYIGLSWYIDTDSNRVRKGVIDDERYWKVRSDYKKIILTTDQDLIKEGVADLFKDNLTFIEYLIKHIDMQWAKVIPLMSNNGRALFGYKVETPEESLVNMKCQCMQYIPGDFTSNCRVCGKQQIQPITSTDNLYVIQSIKVSDIISMWGTCDERIGIELTDGSIYFASEVKPFKATVGQTLLGNFKKK